MSARCTVEGRKRAEYAAACVRDAAPEAVVVVDEPASSRWGRWAVAATLPGAGAVPPAVLGALASADARLRQARVRGTHAHVVATV